MKLFKRRKKSDIVENIERWQRREAFKEAWKEFYCPALIISILMCGMMLFGLFYYAGH